MSTFMERSIPPGDRDDAPELVFEPAPPISTAAALDGLDDDMKAIGAALLDAMRAFHMLAEGNAENSKLACHTAATKLRNHISRALLARVDHVTRTVKARSL